MNRSETFQQIDQTVSLFLNSLVLSLHSREGFNILLAMARLCAVLAIAVNIAMTVHFDSLLVGIAFALYALVAAALLAGALAGWRLQEKQGHFVAIVLFDAFFILFFFTLRKYAQSELYLLLLIPLITAAHFLERRMAVALTALIVLSYFIILAFMLFTNNEYSFVKQLWIWSTRSLFLLVAVLLYRAQRSLPSREQGRIIGPKAARKQLENLLVELKQVVDYDTTSLQLLYGERLVIAACHGFANPDEIQRIEFAKSDPRFPNEKVVRTRRWQIVDTEDYPIFRDLTYHANHVRSWLGVPLISPTTGELIGMLSVDSTAEKAYTRFDALKATCFAREAAAFLIEAPLGPAALTQATRRNDIEKMIKRWKKDLRRIAVECRDDIRLAHEVVKLGQRIFGVEDCSFYLLRTQHMGPHRRRKRVLHLVASSAIPERDFARYECPVSGMDGTGLTGYAVARNVLLNLGAAEIERSRYHSGQYRGHLGHLASGRSRQVLIVPLRDSLDNPIGAFKLENRTGTASELCFVGLEQNLAEVFVQQVGVVLEAIRLRRLQDKQRHSLHDLRTIFSEPVLGRLNELRKHDDLSPETRESVDAIQRGSQFAATAVDNMLYDGLKSVDLGVEGVLPALDHYLELAAPSMPHLRQARSRVKFQPSSVRDEMLPYEVQAAFYNTGREALYNAIRHSRVEENPEGFIDVDFTCGEASGKRTYTLTVRDNGVGFPVSQKRNKETSFGLSAMSKQGGFMQDLGDSFRVDFDSHAGKGTTITATWEGAVNDG